MKTTNDKLVFKIISINDDVKGFHSADDELNDFIKEDALKNQLSMLSVTRLGYLDNALVAYFSLVNDSIKKKWLFCDFGIGVLG